MENTSKKQQIKSIIRYMLIESHNAMLVKIDKVLNSGAIDIDDWDENHQPMIIPKCIVIAILQDESTQYVGNGTNYEKQIKREVKNIKHYL